MLITTALLASFALPAAPIAEPNLTWHQGTLETALGEAGERETLAAVYFWRNGSDYCADFYQNTLGDDRIISAMGDFVLFSAQHGTTEGGELFEKYNVVSLPTILFLDGEGEVEDAVSGFAYADTLVDELARISKDELTVSDLARRVAASEAGTEEHAELLYKQAVKFSDIGNKEANLAALKSIVKADKRGKTLVACKAMLDLEMGTMQYEASDAADAKTWDTASLYKLGKKVKHPEGRFNIYNQLASIEATREDLAKAFKAWMKADETIPEREIKVWGEGVAFYILGQEGQRTSTEKKFVLYLAERSNELAALATEKDCFCEDKANCDHATPEVEQAKYLATLARAYQLNGDAKLAKATAHRCVELNDNDELKEELNGLL